MQLPAHSQSFPRTAGTRRARSPYRVLRRTAGPLKSLLRPIWTQIDRSFQAGAEKAPGSFPTAVAATPIRPMTRDEFDGLAARNSYYHGRDGYLGAAAWVAGDLIDRFGLKTALELGPNLRPLVCGADVMDRVARRGLEASGSVLLHDAMSTPWPLPAGCYDLFVALQVFEHLGTDQAAAFAEVRRVARHAIISLPIGWQMDDPRNPHHGISHERVLSWFAPIAPTRVIVGNPGYRQRLIYTFENLR